MSILIFSDNTWHFFFLFCFSYNMVNLGAYGFEKDTLTYMKNYLSNKLQRV